MITYPVRVREVDTTYESAMGGWNVLNKDGSVICTVSAERDADTIAASLNAVHEFPRMGTMVVSYTNTPDYWYNRVLKWYIRVIQKE